MCCEEVEFQACFQFFEFCPITDSLVISIPTDTGEVRGLTEPKNALVKHSIPFFFVKYCTIMRFVIGPSVWMANEVVCRQMGFEICQLGVVSLLRSNDVEIVGCD